MGRSIPSAGEVERLAKALAAGWHGERDQLMANVAAYSGPRWGEITALTVPRVDTAACVIAVDRMVCGSRPDSGNSQGARCWLVIAACRFNPESALQSPR